MLELNRAERRSLFYATALVLVGAAARLGLGPGADAHRWRPAGPSGGPEREEVRRTSAENLRRARRAARPLAPGERIDPGTAPLEELDRLPGVGPALARAIVEERRRGGPFGDRESLLRVPGIGPARLRRMARHLELPPRRSSPGPAGAAPGDGRILDLNRAGAEELADLPGVGPALAARIVALRVRRGGFTRVEELQEVRGLGPVRLSRLRGLVRVGR